MEVYLDALNTEEYPLKKEVFRKTVSAVNLIPIGALSRSTVINLVISSNNLGVITQDEEFITVHNQARSSVSTLLTHNVAPVMKQIGEALGIECIVGGYYPGWEYAKESRIRDICTDTYRQV
ncbi:MAG TPA: aminoacyl-histidine dipeptidase, partial [Clostridiales bacterium]|nr:aminoacyl-histidine dipeptidase [Clostridiales bacterium]